MKKPLLFIIILILLFLLLYNFRKNIFPDKYAEYIIFKRKPKYKILDLFVERWSPRAMSGQNIEDFELMSLFEAARWAPSSYNNQPWRFIYVKKDSPVWSKLFDILYEPNKIWVKNAAVMILVLSYKYFDFNKQPYKTHSMETGAACQNMALQGYSMGLVVHGIAGFDYQKARELFNISSDYDIEAMYIIGKPGNLNSLPIQLQEKEFKSDRKDFSEFVFKDKFK